MPYYPVIIALIFAVLDWISVKKKWTTLEYLAKPATMLALLWWMWQSAGLGGSMLWFFIGAILCLGGDVFLMVPGDMFLFGIMAFLFGQVFYIIGLNDRGPVFNLLGVAIIIPLVLYVGWLFPKLANGLKTKGNDKLIIPVLVYSVVISLMVYSALMTWTRTGWTDLSALSVSLGALLFYASDSILAWNRFVKPISNGRIINMVTYHLGQFGIVLGAILHTF